MKATEEIVSVVFIHDVDPYGREVTNTDFYIERDSTSVLIAPRRETPAGEPGEYDFVPLSNVRVGSCVAMPVKPTKPAKKAKTRPKRG